MLKAFKRKLSSGTTTTPTTPTTPTTKTAEYDTKHRHSSSRKSSFRHKTVSSTKDVNTKLPPLPKQQYTAPFSTIVPETTHEKLIEQNKINRKHSERYYIYDHSVYTGPTDDSVTRDMNFNIFDKPSGVTHTSARYVIHYLTTFFKDTVKNSVSNNSEDTDMIKAAMEIFKPNLSHFSHDEVKETKKILQSFFPWDGCSLTGKVLQDEIKNNFTASWNKLILALRIIWSYLPQGIIPWESYLKFSKLESKQNYPMMAFYNFIPQVLPNHDYTCCAFEFLEILVTIISKTDLVVDKTSQMDLIFTAGQVCFAKNTQLTSHIESELKNEPDLITLSKLYYTRGAALYHLFVAYLRSLVDEGKIKDFYLIDNFKIEEYPPKEYKPVTQRALTLTVPQFLPSNDLHNDFNQLLKFAAKAQTRIYSSNHTFTKLENSFLDKFEEDPYKIITTLFSRSSKRYLYRFDENFNTDYFKSLNQNSRYNSSLQSMGPKDQYAVATWINSCKNQGFNEFLSVLDDNNFGEGTLALGHGFPGDFQEQKLTEELAPVRVSKMNVSEWFISSWKYETFLGKIHNTMVIKLTKRIGDCDWLVITIDERVGRSCYLTPPTSTDSAKDVGKEKEFSKKKSVAEQLSIPSTTKNKAREIRYSSSSSITSIRSRPPPPNLLGEKSASPLIECSSSICSGFSKVKLRDLPSPLDSDTNSSEIKTSSTSADQFGNVTANTTPGMAQTDKFGAKPQSLVQKHSTNENSNVVDKSQHLPTIESTSGVTTPLMPPQDSAKDPLGSLVTVSSAKETKEYTATPVEENAPQLPLPRLLKVQNPSTTSLSRKTSLLRDSSTARITEEGDTTQSTIENSNITQETEDTMWLNREKKSQHPYAIKVSPPRLKQQEEKRLEILEPVRAKDDIVANKVGDWLNNGGLVKPIDFTHKKLPRSPYPSTAPKGHETGKDESEEEESENEEESGDEDADTTAEYLDASNVDTSDEYPLVEAIPGSFAGSTPTKSSRPVEKDVPETTPAVEFEKHEDTDLPGNAKTLEKEVTIKVTDPSESVHSVKNSASDRSSTENTDSDAASEPTVRGTVDRISLQESQISAERRLDQDTLPTPGKPMEEESHDQESTEGSEDEFSSPLKVEEDRSLKEDNVNLTPDRKLAASSTLVGSPMDVLNDLIDNYNEESVMAAKNHDGPTLFEKVKAFYEQKGTPNEEKPKVDEGRAELKKKKTLPALEIKTMGIDNGAADASLQSVCTPKSTSGFSYNATPPMKHHRRFNRTLGDSPGSNGSGLSMLPDDDGLLSESEGEGEEKREEERKKSIIRSVMLRTKASIRHLNKK